MPAPNILFKGVPRGPTRGFSAEVLRRVQPRLVVIPCTGTFSLAQVAVGAGVPASAIVCGDISLYSSVLGAAIVGAELDVQLADPVEPRFEPLREEIESGDPVRVAAAVLFAIRVLQQDREKPTIFLQDVQRELLTNREGYLRELREGVQRLVGELHGLSYMARDLWETLEAYRQDPGVCFLFNPPRYTGGYDRQFKGVDRVFRWTPPPARQFTQKDYLGAMELLGREDSRALTLLYYATPAEDPAPLWGPPWRSLFADKPGSAASGAINWIVANRDPLPLQVSRSRLQTDDTRYPLFEGDVTPETVLTARRIPAAVGDYYRDLFVHRLAAAATEAFVGVFADGRLLAVVGLHMQTMQTGAGKASDATDDRCIHLTFAFSVPHPRYARLHKLTLLAATSEWFYRDAFGRDQ